ncbi:ficolin-1 isoform X2 [Drosophila grimshawi]|uniref:ficolin-1 isoform X2 n=1 Tax=Drosophila grimshawi TaxID=7222 RepID=UPI000C871596|nr:ficolin-1 isoform X2 [Drosophila grimshawi]
MNWEAGIGILLLFLNWNSCVRATNPTNDGIMTSSPLAHLQELYEKAEDLISRVEINRMQKSSRSAETTKIAKQQAYPPSCLAAMINTNGIYTIEVPGLRPFPVSCDTGKAGAGWTVIQRRQDGSENFYRSWAEYRTGFGNLSAEFFMGLEQLHRITNAEPYELFVQLEDFDGESHYAKYDRFVVANESEAYALRVLGKYTGDAGDSLRYHVGMPFSTFDNDKTTNHCALTYVGAWWYNACQHSNLNGQYVEGGNYEVKLSGRGICWQSWRGYDYGYKLTQMMIRPRCRATSKAP